MGKAFTIDGERSVALLKIDIEIDHVGRNFLGSQGGGNFADACFGKVAVAALLIAEAPERRQRRAADEAGVLLDYFLGVGAGEKIVVELATFGAKGKVIWRFLAEIKAAAVGVIKKHAPGSAFEQSHEKSDGLVHGVGGLTPSENVCVPHGESAIAPVHGTGLVAQAVVIFVGRHFLPHVYAGTIEGHWESGLVGE